MNENTGQIYQPQICESCGEEFGCGAKLDGCWCMKVTISDRAAADIKARFGSCLCPNCLNRFASNPEVYDVVEPDPNDL